MMEGLSQFYGINLRMRNNNNTISRFQSWPRQSLSCLRAFSCGFLSPSRQIPGWYPKSGHDHFLRCPFQTSFSDYTKEDIMSGADYCLTMCDMLPTLRRRMLPFNLIVTPFIKSNRSLSWSQGSTFELHPEPVESGFQHYKLFLKIFLSICFRSLIVKSYILLSCE
jgi:hypothetical protein